MLLSIPKDNSAEFEITKELKIWTMILNAGPWQSIVGNCWSCLIRTKGDKTIKLYILAPLLKTTCIKDIQGSVENHAD